MPLLRWLEKLHLLNIKFLLPLPLILITFGFGGESLTNLLLKLSYHTKDKLHANTNTLRIQLVLNVLISEIKTEVFQAKNFTNVKIKTTNSTLKKLEFEVPVTELDSVKVEIAQELGLSPKFKLPSNITTQIKPKIKVLGILAEIQKKKGITRVEIRTANSILKSLEFEFSITELSQVKATINKELGITREDARMFVSYRIKK
ncbi:MAG: hypothetical protein KME60_08420 [Cyanomargarita calcarea GSE-NOS-MK-12-04C]|jgi:hypothetical protein|uniref:Uncharacterized protein n=1 Tax=Cyanomargarita calcarea GSE-NOS-MK-12-04C TaxID=2839659 RepID=A0A951UU54_9CYAN|nr:hypothetical protein [Cyanomargarita calcarea GSE-NOS-MK-12-04C]